MSDTRDEHEKGFLKFVLPPQQRRLGTLLALGDKRRSEVRSLLDHAIRLDPRYVVPLEHGQQFSEPIERLLTAIGAPANCWVVAANAKIDGHRMPLKQALKAIVGSGSGAFISCIPGELGYFEHEHENGGQIVNSRPFRWAG